MLKYISSTNNFIKILKYIYIYLYYFIIYILFYNYKIERLFGTYSFFIDSQLKFNFSLLLSFNTYTYSHVLNRIFML